MYKRRREKIRRQVQINILERMVAGWEQMFVNSCDSTSQSNILSGYSRCNPLCHFYACSQCPWPGYGEKRCEITGPYADWEHSDRHSKKVAAAVHVLETVKKLLEQVQ